jgi:hypothetical protein
MVVIMPAAVDYIEGTHYGCDNACCSRLHRGHTLWLRNNCECRSKLILEKFFHADRRTN